MFDFRSSFYYLFSVCYLLKFFLFCLFFFQLFKYFLVCYFKLSIVFFYCIDIFFKTREGEQSIIFTQIFFISIFRPLFLTFRVFLCHFPSSLKNFLSQLFQNKSAGNKFFEFWFIRKCLYSPFLKDFFTGHGSLTVLLFQLFKTVVHFLFFWTPQFLIINSQSLKLFFL